MKAYLIKLAERIVFMGFVYGVLWLMFIMADSGSGSSVLSSARYYFWMVLPLVVFGIIFNAVALVFRRNRSELPEG